MPRLAFIVLASALAVVAPAAADAPERTTTFVPFNVVDEDCGFPIQVTGERTRTTTVYADGDVRRHTQLIVTSTANGKTIVSRNSFNVFIDAESPNVWVITGTFEKAQLHGRTIWLESGRLLYDFEADQLVDPNRGPLAEPPAVCDVLAPQA
jgi:hypothetical protein